MAKKQLTSVCNLSMTFSINLHVSFVFRCLDFAFASPFGLGRFFPSPLTSGGHHQCLNSGPASEPGVNEGWFPCFGLCL